MAGTLFIFGGILLLEELLNYISDLFLDSRPGVLLTTKHSFSHCRTFMSKFIDFLSAAWPYHLNSFIGIIHAIILLL